MALLLLGGFGMSLLLVGSFRAHPRTANRQKNGAPHQEVPHDSYEVSLANHSALTFSLHASLATNASEHATHESLAHLQRSLYSPTA